MAAQGDLIAYNIGCFLDNCGFKEGNVLGYLNIVHKGECKVLSVSCRRFNFVRLLIGT